ncbi:MAG: 50S ribosomal protein L22 [Patescibacteria group bacterium]|mgnify:CR=1 FL=1
MKATLKNYRQSPRKVRLVTDLVKGKTLSEAMTLLKFNIKRASDPILKLLASAAANAQKQGENPSDLVVSNITVNEAPTMFRMMPRARGSAYRIRKRSSHVTVTLDKKK